MDLHNKYYHWVFGENILRNDAPTYLINLELGLSIKFDYGDSYFSTFEDFFENIADIQFLSGERPNETDLQNILIDAWNFLALFEEEEENRAELRSFDDDY